MGINASQGYLYPAFLAILKSAIAGRINSMRVKRNPITATIAEMIKATAPLAIPSSSGKTNNISESESAVFSTDCIPSETF